jgi:hypothetical protein
MRYRGTATDGDLGVTSITHIIAALPTIKVPAAPVNARTSGLRQR